MRRQTAIRAAVAASLFLGLFVVARLLWTTPLAPMRAKAPIGKLNLERPGATLLVRLIPPKDLTSIAIVFPKPIEGSQEWSANPDLQLKVRVRLSESAGTYIIDKVIAKDQMEWTNWHRDPSLLLNLHRWIGQDLRTDRQYDLSISVDSAVSGLGEVEVFLHWIDGGYVWGREEQRLQIITSRSRE